MKIARVSGQSADPLRKVIDARSNDVDDIRFALQLTAHDHEIGLQDALAIGGKHLRPEDDVVDPRFIFERSEDHTLRGLRMLQVSDESTYADSPPGLH